MYGTSSSKLSMFQHLGLQTTGKIWKNWDGASIKAAGKSIPHETEPL